MAHERLVELFETDSVLIDELVGLKELLTKYNIYYSLNCDLIYVFYSKTQTLDGKQDLITITITITKDEFIQKISNEPIISSITELFSNYPIPLNPYLLTTPNMCTTITDLTNIIYTCVLWGYEMTNDLFDSVYNYYKENLETNETPTILNICSMFDDLKKISNYQTQCVMVGILSCTMINVFDKMYLQLVMDDQDVYDKMEKYHGGNMNYLNNWICDKFSYDKFKCMMYSIMHNTWLVYDNDVEKSNDSSNVIYLKYGVKYGSKNFLIMLFETMDVMERDEIMKVFVMTCSDTCKIIFFDEIFLFDKKLGINIEKDCVCSFTELFADAKNDASRCREGDFFNKWF